MNSKQYDEAFMALLEAEVREQEQREMKRDKQPEAVCRVGCKGPTLHFRGRGRQGIQLVPISGGKT